jgi:2-dehydro-3-deoxygluconokinase
MARLMPQDLRRLRQALPGPLDVSFGGAESNVAASIAELGGRARFVTALPSDNDLAAACVAFLRGLDVDVSHVLRVSDGRMGLYFVEAGANQRPSRVLYDRAGSSIAVTPSSAYDWPSLLDGAGWLHVSGITPAVSRSAADATLEAVRVAHAGGVTVSCDLNFRKKLWRWESGSGPKELARRVMAEILRHVDVVIANEEDAHDVLGITAGSTDVEAGALDVARYPEVAAKIAERYPNVNRVAITLRQSVSASHNDWGALLWETSSRQAFFAPGQPAGGSDRTGTGGERYEPYRITHIVDRVGGGDAFAGALVFALTTPELAAPELAVRFAAAASCLAHSVVGDVNFVSRAEVEALMGGFASGRVQR